MPLTRFQSEIARLLAVNRTPDSYLAGGAALHIEPNGKRYSNDLDFFQDSVGRVITAFDQDRALLAGAGCQVDVILNPPGFVRAMVTRSKDATKVEWSHDSAWRFLPTVRSDVCGYQLHPMDLAINKLLALVGRDEPRDLLDTVHVHQNVLPLGAICWAAVGKDPGYTPGLLLELLRRRGKVRPEDLNRLHLTEPVDLHELKRAWLDALEQSSAFVRSRPPDELGCLYYSRSLGKFVQPGDESDIVPHYGRPGGVLPVIVPTA
jgi:hypothetical protein